MCRIAFCCRLRCAARVMAMVGCGFLPPCPSLRNKGCDVFDTRFPVCSVRCRVWSCSTYRAEVLSITLRKRGCAIFIDDEEWPTACLATERNGPKPGSVTVQPLNGKLRPEIIVVGIAPAYCWRPGLTRRAMPEYRYRHALQSRGKWFFCRKSIICFATSKTMPRKECRKTHPLQGLRFPGREGHERAR